MHRAGEGLDVPQKGQADLWGVHKGTWQHVRVHQKALGSILMEISKRNKDDPLVLPKERDGSRCTGRALRSRDHHAGPFKVHQMDLGGPEATAQSSGRPLEHQKRHRFISAEHRTDTGGHL